MPKIQSASLYFREGSSDKEYHVSIEEVADGFLVNIAYGRRGSTLTAGTKTQAPVTREKATRIFEKLVAEKTAKGYTAASGGVAFTGTADAGRVSGHLPQLLNAIAESEATFLLRDPNVCAQEKFDGERRGVVTAPDGPKGINRKGLFVALPEAIATAVAAAVPADSVLDSEQVGEVFHVFDATRIGGVAIAGLPYSERLAKLSRILGESSTSAVRLVPTAIGEAAKRELLDSVKARNGEGIVFKALDAPYTAGRPNSGGAQLKYKFVDTAQVIVAAQNAQRSVQMAVIEAGVSRFVGNVTIPPNHSVPAVGAIIEVEYLYAFPQGALFQPVYRGERGDLSAEDCTAARLKYKAAEPERLAS